MLSFDWIIILVAHSSLESDKDLRVLTENHQTLLNILLLYSYTSVRVIATTPQVSSTHSPFNTVDKHMFTSFSSWHNTLIGASILSTHSPFNTVDKHMFTSCSSWHNTLIGASILNTCIFIGLWIQYHNRISVHEFILTGCYLANCVFRSIVPQNTTKRVTLCPSFVSTVFNDRLIATVGELALTHQIVQHFQLDRMVFYQIVLAQTLCWIALLCNLPALHMAENFLWAVMAAIVAVANPNQWMVAFFCVLFVIYIVGFDLPLYYHKPNAWMNPMTGLSAITSRSAGWFDLGFWKEEMLWMTGYFVCCPWVSFYLLASCTNV